MDQEPAHNDLFLASAIVAEAMREGHLSKASRLLKLVLDESQLRGSISAPLDDSANKLAEYYFAAGDYVSAAELYRAILSAKIKLLGPSHPQVRETERKLAKSLWEAGGLSPPPAFES